jgi:GT2 family glycosyltransferase
VVEQPAGALLLFRRSVWEQLGGFDERFRPAWFEDVDFCRRLRDLGYSIELVPEVTALHQGGHSVGGLPAGRRIGYWYGSLLRYAAKHFQPAAFRMVCLAVVAGSVLRMVAGMAAVRSFDSVRAFGAVIALAGRGFLAGRRAMPHCQ